MLLKSRTIRTGVDLGPCRVAVQRPDPFKGPTKLFMAYVEDGYAKVATSLAVDRIPVQWDFGYSLTTAIDVAIEFDGAWKQGGNRRFNFYTIGSPWIAMVRPDGRLVVQQGQLDTPNEIAADKVTKVAMVRGWKGVSQKGKDQGLIVAYIRDGAVYYRNRAEQADGSVLWESQKAVNILPSPVENIAVFRTNDYRVGFIAEVAGKLHWAITERMWAGMGIGDEHIEASLTDYEITVHEIINNEAKAEEHISASLVDFWIGPLLYGLSPNPVLVENLSDGEEEENWGTLIKIHFDHDVYDPEDQENAFTVKDEDGTKFAVIATDQGDSIREVILDVQDFNFAYGMDLTVIYDDSVGTMKGEAGQKVDSFEETFAPVNLEPPDVGPPELEAIWNE